MAQSSGEMHKKLLTVVNRDRRTGALGTQGKGEEFISCAQAGHFKSRIKKNKGFRPLSAQLLP